MDIKLKQLLLEMLDDIVHVCHINNIRFYLIGGSMLGAIRHKGIIPWDDDIDVAMPREDYEKFKIIAPHALSSRFKFVTNQLDKNYHYFFGKIYHESTTLIEFEDPFYVAGVFIDIFPIDGMPTLKLFRNIHSFIFQKAQSVSYIVARSKPEKVVSIKNLIKFLINKCFTLTTVMSICEKLARMYSFNSSKYVANLAGAWGKKEITLKANFADSVYREFEGRLLPLPNGYENILVELYGDYMKLPPEDKQKSHHNQYYINLDCRLSVEEISIIKKQL